MASCVPLAERALYIPDRGKAITAGLILGLTVTVVAFGLLPAAVAFIAGVLASMVLRTVPEVYEAVDWPVLVPHGALIPVAVAASCAFLTPIGHQNNTLILGPGGFRFGDYWRMGLPLDLIVIGIGLPTLIWVWPL